MYFGSLPNKCSKVFGQSNNLFVVGHRPVPLDQIQMKISQIGLVLLISAQLSSSIYDTKWMEQCSARTIHDVNETLLPSLQTLVKTPLFRFYKANLKKECKFWNENMLCSLKDCTVIEAQEDDIPKIFKKESLSSVNYNPFGLYPKKTKIPDQDFCVLEDEDDQDGAYINLLENPERYTGYAGESANRVWQSIYNENCFGIPNQLSQIEQIMQKNEQCLEKNAFYNLISGLHTSISTHICGDWLDRNTGEWIMNYNCYKYRIGMHPERIENLYFLWSLMVRAITKLSPYLQTYPFISNNEEKVWGIN
jgi:hypothetical protein